MKNSLKCNNPGDISFEGFEQKGKGMKQTGFADDALGKFFAAHHSKINLRSQLCREKISCLYSNLYNTIQYIYFRISKVTFSYSIIFKIAYKVTKSKDIVITLREVAPSLCEQPFIKTYLHKQFTLSIIAFYTQTFVIILIENL